jgi:hypothetical protein
VRAHLADGGLVACALADDLDAFDGSTVELPLPDTAVVDGVSYSSQPVALRDAGDRMAIERVRTIVSASGARSSSDDVIHLDKLDAEQVAAEARAAGLASLGVRVIPPTEEHVGTTVVMLRG